ncbi:MAG: hypothetical protein PVF58_07855 [Candidatus Methanofastidiosia archaeon]|jgi:hypothetical protein
MTFEIGLSTQSPEEYQNNVTRGKAEEKIIKIREIMESLNEEISRYITEPCNVTLELSGSTTMEGGGGVEVLVLNIGGNIEKTSGMKMVLNFKINPKK